MPSRVVRLIAAAAVRASAQDSGQDVGVLERDGRNGRYIGLVAAQHAHIVERVDVQRRHGGRDRRHNRTDQCPLRSTSERGRSGENCECNSSNMLHRTFLLFFTKQLFAWLSHYVLLKITCNFKYKLTIIIRINHIIE
jgi:hypothetical protein